jgi:hypothetical protein
MNATSKTEADVKCYFCGKISGSIIEERLDGQLRRSFKPSVANSPYRATAGKPLRCLRCGGPVFIEDVRPIKPEEPPFQFRQRRPKQPKVTAAA